MAVQQCEYTKSLWILHFFSGWIEWYVNYLSIKLLLGHLMQLIGKEPDAEEDWRQQEK